MCPAFFFVKGKQKEACSFLPKILKKCIIFAFSLGKKIDKPLTVWYNLPCMTMYKHKLKGAILS